MKIALNTEAFNIVVLGTWNPAVFSPEWAKENLADDKTKEVVLSIAMPPGIVPNRLTIDDVNIYVSPASLAIDYTSYVANKLDSSFKKLDLISDLLKHTPVSAVGINFRFLGNIGENAELLNLFSLSDAAKINSSDFQLSDVVIRRTFKLADNTILNLTIDNRSSELHIEFNFHSEIKNLAELKAKISAEKAVSYQNQSIKFLSDVYGITLEE